MRNGDSPRLQEGRLRRVAWVRRTVSFSGGRSSPGTFASSCRTQAGACVLISTHSRSLGNDSNRKPRAHPDSMEGLTAPARSPAFPTFATSSTTPHLTRPSRAPALTGRITSSSSQTSSTPTAALSGLVMTLTGKLLVRSALLSPVYAKIRSDDVRNGENRPDLLANR